MKAYSELKELGHFYLEDSYVLGVVASPGVLRFDMDYVLTHTHPMFSPARPGEQYCYRHGRLIFNGVTSLRWDEQGRPPALDASGQADFGNVDSLILDDDGLFLIEGNFGKIAVSAKTLEVSLD